MRIPLKITAGDSVSWADFPFRDIWQNSVHAPDWTLKYAIRGAVTLDLTAVGTGSEWWTSISAAQSNSLTPGVYFWQCFVEKGSERITVGHGQLEVLPNMATASAGFDGRSQARRDLEAVQAAMRAMISGGAVQRYAIGNRQVDKMTMSDLITLESKLKTEVAREEKAQKIKNGLGNPDNLFVRFR